MAKPHVTITGNVGNEPFQTTTSNGTPITLFSVAQNHWRPGPRNTWEDAGTSWYHVVCRWGWSENVANSLEKGDPVVVVGKLRINDRVTDHGERRVTAEIDAISVGHDLRRGVSKFSKVERARNQMPNDEDEISDLLEESRPNQEDPFPPPSTAADSSQEPSADPPAGDEHTDGGRQPENRSSDFEGGEGFPTEDGRTLNPV